ncbi:hypothetical protein QR685DRAFT_6657 [Neurospora intermedia]|uniref:Uncharacterized protein n=1 Tax=Neurospora intermedia TaxID=5142 RepID=A0ABR3DNW8_NEUIN
MSEHQACSPPVQGLCIMTFFFLSAGFFLFFFFSLAYATVFGGRWLMDGTGGLYGAILGACAQNTGRAIWNSVSVGLEFGLCRSRSSFLVLGRQDGIDDY